MVAKRSEASLKSALREWALSKLGVEHSSLVRATGQSDDVFWVFGGSPVLFEFKVPGQTADPHQVLWFKRMRHKGYTIYVCANLQQAKDILMMADAAGRMAGTVNI